MIPIIHKVNSIQNLKKVPKDYGVEVDIRNSSSGLILSHEIGNSGTMFEDYLENYEHKLLIANIKESGIENHVIKIIQKKNIEDFFLLDVEFPYTYQNYLNNKEFLSTRYSKYESIESVKNLIDKVEWLWIDTYSDFKIDSVIAKIMKNFKICLVSPSRWGSPQLLNSYIDKFTNFSLKIEAIMIENSENPSF
ncbi:hypothetical protein N9437_03130 [Acidimicrobiia bacterium]|nr:hypothetical protein [Acidimicrobiia bacterium]